MVTRFQASQHTNWSLFRSSHPLAKLMTNPVERRSSPSFSSDISNYWYWDAAHDEVTVSHPETTPAASSASSSARVRRDPARAVKFSPEGSSRDLLVFTEVGSWSKPALVRNAEKAPFVPS